MKKLITIFISAMIVLTTVSCADPKFIDFEEYEDDYISIVEFVRSYYEENKPEDGNRITIDFGDDYMEATSDVNKEIIIPKELKSSLTTVNKEFNYLWVDGDSVIFWKGELKEYGLLWSEDPKDVIRSMREEWYISMESVRINSEWYEIGTLSSI